MAIKTEHLLIVGGVVIAGAYALSKLLAEKPKPGLYGLVVDALTGDPIEGIVATLNSAETTTDLNGKFQFLNITPGTYTLILTDPAGRYREYEYLE